MTQSALRSQKLSALRSASPEIDLPAAELPFHVSNWLLDGEVRQLSPAVIATRRLLLSKLQWFLEQREFLVCGKQELRHFFAYVSRGHEAAGGRWGNPHLTRPVRPRTVKDYHSHLRTFFRWLLAEGVLDASPMESIAAPITRADQIQPFSKAQVMALLAAARQSDHPRRDEAVLLFLLDTGVRATEACSIRFLEVNMKEHCCRVLGKGNKHRTVYFGLEAGKALYRYLREKPRASDDPLFLSERGGPLTRYGLRQIVERAGRVAKIETARCSVHTWRHTMAVTFLREGGQAFVLKELLGHTDIKQTARYVSFAQADLAAQHRRFSPADSLRKH